MSLDAVPNKPSYVGLVFRGDKDSPSSLSIVDAGLVADRIGHRLFAAFLKCFVGADRILALEHLLALNIQHVDKDCAAFDRNLRVTALLLSSALYELGKALQELCNAQMVEQMRDHAAWQPLNELRKKLTNHRALRAARNQLGHHLGDSQVYDVGLSKVLARDERELLFWRSDGRHRHQAECVAGWEVLFEGLGLSESERADLISFTRESHENAPDLITKVFVEVLAAAGIAVEVGGRDTSAS